MLVNLKDMLETAKENHFAVGAFNATELCLCRAVIEEAEKTNTPAILQFAVGEFNFDTKDFFKYLTSRAKSSKVPFVIHLDHGKSQDDCVRAIQAGFTSVMFDGSELPFEENINNTKKIVEIAHACGVSVEGEIGTIGAMDNSDEGGVTNITYTKPSDVVTFVDKTGIDALAIAIGTAHGIYPKNYKPQLQLDLLKEIVKISSTPLVLHGGSNNPDEEIRKACEIGIQKVNISSDIKQQFFDSVRKKLNTSDCFLPPKIFGPAIQDVQMVVNHKMDLFGSLGKASLY